MPAVRQVTVIMATKCRYLVMMLVLGAIPTSAQLCPYHMDIAPCLCTENGPSQELDIDCSHVVDIDQLTRIFQADFPFINYRRLTMTGTPDDPLPLTFLPNGVFGTITFQEIIIQHTQIRRVDDNVILGSKASLTQLMVTYSELTSFPTTVLPLMSDLKQLDLSHNNIVFIPDLRSSSLRSLNLAHNSQLSFTSQVFTELDHIVDLNIGHCNIDTLAPGIFLNMVNLSTIYLEYNKLTHLDAASLHFTSNVIEEIVLSGNQITSVEPNFFSGKSWQPSMISHIIMQLLTFP